jgi:pyruvate-ferredoxin/flavodoxin oxidoreductase
LYRYDPRNPAAPLTIDSAEPTLDYKEFLMGENRYASLVKKDPTLAETLFKASADEAQQRRNTLKQIVAAQVK